MKNANVEIIQRIKANSQVFEELYQKYADKVYSYFWYRTGHQKDVAEDLMQETFFRAFKYLDRFQTRGYSYLTYLLTIAHNILVNYYRSNKMIPLSELDDDIDIPAEVTDMIERKAEAENLWKAVQDLSKTDRDVILMFYQKEMSIKDISRVMGRSENAVKLILSRARKKLAKHPYLHDIVGYTNQEQSYTKPRLLKVKKE